MEHVHNDELSDVARLVEVTSDAVAICDEDGTVRHVNRQLLTLGRMRRSFVVGADIKDILYSADFERSGHHAMPFTADGADNTLMLKLSDGSFIPVRVRAIELESSTSAHDDAARHRYVVAIRSLEERYAQDRKTQRLLSELQAANKRLSGTLSVIMSTVGSKDMTTLLDTVLNRMTETLDATGATMYFAESGGFKLRGASCGLSESYIPDFMPYGAGVPTYVLREQRACRLSLMPGAPGDPTALGAFYDLDARVRHNLRIQDMPPFKTLIAVPVYFGTQVLGIVELGWARPCSPRVYDVRVLEVICDYLSIELMGVVSSVRSARTAGLARSLSRVRDILLTYGDDRMGAWAAMMDEVREQLSCRLLPVLYDLERKTYLIDFDGGSQIDLPADVEETFFSVTAPAARVGAAASGFARNGDGPLAVTDEPKLARLARVDRTTWMGEWLERHGLPCQGVFVDMGFDPEEGIFVEDAGPFARVLPSRRFLLLRDGSQEPVDDMEFDYLTHLARDFELVMEGARQQESERRIAQTLQAGMRNSLGSVPGITTDALYSSATQQALVGGDFYTLIRLPDDRAVMILGDVSGKGVEAASMSSLVKTALTAYAWEGASPARMARSLNRMLMSFSRVETFVTVFIAKLDLRHGRATYCSAGHPPTMLLHVSDSGEVEAEQLSVQSGVVGAFESMVYENGAFSFTPGDMLFMYTDGAIEARREDGEFFGEVRLREVLLRAAAGGMEGLCSQVLGELDQFTGSALDDDIALVALRFDERSHTRVSEGDLARE
ncbi:MAG: SpoIIE family protein phosphatase [Coriobacteriaceae bacterium]|nr:SpoIIE family protein phosphatase [Coriobacteriaceae bacterium]